MSKKEKAAKKESAVNNQTSKLADIEKLEDVKGVSVETKEEKEVIPVAEKSSESGVDIDKVFKDATSYQKGEGRTGRSKSSLMALWRAAAKEFLAYCEQQGVKEIQIGALVHALANNIKGFGGHYRKSYNYYRSFIEHGHLPEGWEEAQVDGQAGLRLKEKPKAEEVANG